jgi:hypothetical protein
MESAMDDREHMLSTHARDLPRRNDRTTRCGRCRDGGEGEEARESGGLVDMYRQVGLVEVRTGMMGVRAGKD